MKTRNTRASKRTKSVSPIVSPPVTPIVEAEETHVETEDQDSTGSDSESKKQFVKQLVDAVLNDDEDDEEDELDKHDEEEDGDSQEDFDEAEEAEAEEEEQRRKQMQKTQLEDEIASLKLEKEDAKRKYLKKVELEREIALLSSILGKARIEEGKRIDQQRQKLDQKKNKELAQRKRTMEVDVFRANSIDFVHLLQGPFYVHRVADSKESDHFVVSRACHSVAGEFIGCWDKNNFITHPWNRGDISESYTAKQIVTRETIDHPGRRQQNAAGGRIMNGVRHNPNIASAAAKNQQLAQMAQARADAELNVVRAPPLRQVQQQTQQVQQRLVYGRSQPPQQVQQQMQYIVEEPEPPVKVQGSFGGFPRRLTEGAEVPTRMQIVPPRRTRKIIVNGDVHTFDARFPPQEEEFW